MAYGVYYVDLEIELNLTEADLGHPGLPGLWERLRGQKWEPGHLQCIECRETNPGCPEWMYLRQYEAGGRRHAVHHNRSIRAHPARESDLHKALKERTARAAEAAGLSSVIEDAASDRHRITDVTVTGPDGFRLGVEAQVSYATAASVATRTAVARADGLAPLWITNSTKAPLIDRAPWVRIYAPNRWVVRDDPLMIQGGFRTLEMVRCEERYGLCPDRRRKKCGGWHPVWNPEQREYNRLIAEAATRDLVAFEWVRSARSSSWMMVPAADRVRYLEACPPEAPAALVAPVPMLDEPFDLPAVEPDRECRYGQRGDFVPEPTRPRDTGAVLVGESVQLSERRYGDPCPQCGTQALWAPRSILRGYCEACRSINRWAG